MDLRNRIVAHRTLPASSLRPHPSNPRTHPDELRSVLRQLLAEIGLARSVLGYVADADRASALAALGHDPLCWRYPRCSGHLDHERRAVLHEQAGEKVRLPS